MAAKRGKSQARRNNGNSGLPGWAWLVLGILLTIGAVLLAPKFLGSDEGNGFFRADSDDTNARPPALDNSGNDNEPIVAEDSTPVTDDATDAKTPDYDFYTLLPGEETPISDAELAESARAESASKTTSTAPTTTDTRKPPPAIDAATPTKPDTRDAPARPQTTTAASTASDARYILQAGAFGASGDAEALKAKIAFLGLSARVESAQIKGKTVYRVRMGPYGTASELAEAKQKLASSGLPALAIRAK